MRGIGSAIAIVSLLGCAGTRAMEADRSYQAGLAAVERIEVKVFPERPVSVYVEVHGQLPDGCTELDRSRQDRLGSGIEVTLATRSEFGPSCAEGPRPFERRIPIDVVGLPAGLYVVDVNGVRESFQILNSFSVPPGPEHLRNW